MSVYLITALFLQSFLLAFILLISIYTVVIFFNAINPFFDILTVFLYIRCVFISYLLLISGDIEQNPGPKSTKNLSICHWNIGSIPTNNFFKLS